MLIFWEIPGCARVETKDLRVSAPFENRPNPRETVQTFPPG
mgnify:FL=1